jgi:predicted deacetylase
MRRELCIELHDVAAATWPQCERLLEVIDELEQAPATLLVVPDYHGNGSLSRAPVLVHALQRRIGRGDEIALHGYLHRDDAAPPRNPCAWLRRRMLTAGEGEFAALPRDEAARRIGCGWHELTDLFGPVRGFVAPAWLNSAGAWHALRESPLQYSATRRTLIVLDDMRQVAAPAITVSARTRWRRAVSRVWLRALCRATARLPLVRVALHPVDAQHPDVIDDWRRALRMLLAQREPVTVSGTLGLA